MVSILLKFGSNTNERYEFNDVIVRDFNLEDLANEAYGIKNRNAYLLFYERKKKYHPNGTEISEIK